MILLFRLSMCVWFAAALVLVASAARFGAGAVSLVQTPKEVRG